MEIRARHRDLQTKGTAPTPNKLPSDLAIARCWKSSDAIQSGHLLSYLIKHRLIKEHQFGFVPEKSTTHQILCIVVDWLQTLDDGKGFAAVFMDIQKAFDRVWHDGLLYKLGLRGIKPAALSWVRSYLTDWSISV